jgi:3-phenylpropionate/trans-cinnamate dioxygenase ferredoxin subunit
VSDLIDVAAADDVADGTMMKAEFDGHELLVARVGADYFIADGRCPHLGGHLYNGVLEGTVVTCPRHHSRFDLTDGHVVRWTDWQGAVLTVAELVKHPRPLRVYEVTVDGGRVLMGPQKPPVESGE